MSTATFVYWITRTLQEQDMTQYSGGYTAVSNVNNLLYIYIHGSGGCNERVQLDSIGPLPK